MFCKLWHMGRNYFLECLWRGSYISLLAGVVNEVAAVMDTACNPLSSTIGMGAGNNA